MRDTFQDKSIIVMGFIFISLILIEPVAAEELGGELESVDWWKIIESLLKFFANVFIEAGELLREGADLLIEMFTDE